MGEVIERMAHHMLPLVATYAGLVYIGIGAAYAIYLDQRDPRRIRSLILIGIFWPVVMLLDGWGRRGE